MTQTVTGAFDVKLGSPDDVTAGTPLGAMTLDKTYHGPLAATAKGVMLSGMGTVKGSAGYVAMEHVTGTLGGHTGSFMLQHTGTMARGAQSLSITVVPDSGTDGLAGLSGSMAIRIEEGKHFYDFSYEIKESQ